MRYISTRGGIKQSVSFTEAVAMGLSPDGGLLIPERLPELSSFLAKWESLDYVKLCQAFFGHFATDLDPVVLNRCIEQAYQKFEHADIAPLVALDAKTYVLELFHGPTLAFKDFALQLLGNFYAEQIKRTGLPINVLGATSGDTGAAAIHGLIGREGVNIFILYPEGGVSPLQERQMACTGASNVHALAVQGSFDDCQAIIKSIFGDVSFKETQHLSAVNSINIARILAQCVYYLYAFLRLPAEKRSVADFVVPTGNFGNVLAGWMLQQMGVPIRSFCVATNRNDILYRFFTTGTYAVGKMMGSHAPSMDIQVASNFERFIYYAVGQDPVKVTEIMKAFAADGKYVFESFDTGTFTASRCDDIGIEAAIADCFERFGYVIDPHTACGYHGLRSDAISVILSTAHPAKFPALIEQTLHRDSTHPALEALKSEPIQKTILPASENAVRQYIQAHV
jgi:threonine synthase